MRRCVPPRGKPVARRCRFHGCHGLNPWSMDLAEQSGQKLYLRIWLAVVAAVAVLTLVVGWLWQVALDHEREQNENRAGREIVLRNSGRRRCGPGAGPAVRVPGEGLSFRSP
jgi:hypothetical protein